MLKSILTKIPIRQFLCMNIRKSAMITTQKISKHNIGGFMQFKFQARCFSNLGDDYIKELKRHEDWKNYSTKVSEERPIIVAFFTKYFLKKLGGAIIVIWSLI